MSRVTFFICLVAVVQQRIALAKRSRESLELHTPSNSPLSTQNKSHEAEPMPGISHTEVEPSPTTNLAESPPISSDDEPMPGTITHIIRPWSHRASGASSAPQPVPATTTEAEELKAWIVPESIIRSWSQGLLTMVWDIKDSIGLAEVLAGAAILALFWLGNWLAIGPGH